MDRVKSIHSLHTLMTGFGCWTTHLPLFTTLWWVFKRHIQVRTL